MNDLESAVLAFLLPLGWKQDSDYFGATTVTDPHGDYQVMFADGLWELSRFDDSDNDEGVATARWLNDDEGGSVEELRFALTIRAEQQETRMGIDSGTTAK